MERIIEITVERQMPEREQEGEQEREARERGKRERERERESERERERKVRWLIVRFVRRYLSRDIYHEEMVVFTRRGTNTTGDLMNR
jgi:hypothetical protein